VGGKCIQAQHVGEGYVALKVKHIHNMPSELLLHGVYIVNHCMCVLPCQWMYSLAKPDPRTCRDLASPD